MKPRHPACLFLAFVVAARAATAEALPPVIVTAPRADSDYRAETAGVGPTKRPLIKTPASVTVVTRAVMDDQQARGITAAVVNDPSVSENYAPVGYYESLSIRGFTLDNATAYKRDGLTIANESSMPLENKERVEILKGVAGFEAGLAAPGGTLNYAVKRPTPVSKLSLEFALSERGTRYTRADAGGRFGAGRFGYRFNAAREDYHPYVKEAVGHRDFASVFLDWRTSERTRLEFDADWQKKSQLSVPGYQALNGALPAGVRPEKMLNNQPWSAPVSINASNIGANFAYRSDADLRLTLSVNRNRLVSDDSVAFPYGCSSGPVYLTTFCGNGDYDLYDYRSPGEVRTATQVQAVASKEFQTGPVLHEAVFGASRFERAVNIGKPVYDFVGSDNIYNPNPLIFAPSPLVPEPVYRVQDYSELALFARDTVSFTPRWKLQAALRVSAVSDDHFSRLNGNPVSRYARTLLAPQFALTFMPRSDTLAYASYSQGLELGGTAPTTAANAGQINDPKISRQFELGAKRDISERLSLTAAAFLIRKPYEFTNPNNIFVSRGAVTHRGLEFSAAGSATDHLRVIGGATLINARHEGTGVPSFDGKAPVNVPWLRGRAAADYGVASVPGLAFDGALTYASEKFAVRDNTLATPAYRLYDAGVRYARSVGPVRVTWRLRVENLLDTVYWKDVGESGGDGYLHLGAPRTFKLSAQFDF